MGRLPLGWLALLFMEKEWLCQRATVQCVLSAQAFIIHCSVGSDVGDLKNADRMVCLSCWKFDKELPKNNSKNMYISTL